MFCSVFRVNAQLLNSAVVSAGTNNVTIVGSVQPGFSGQTLRLEAEVKCTNESFNTVPDFVGTPSVVSGNGIFFLTPISINYNQLCPGAHYKVRVRAYNVTTVLQGHGLYNHLGLILYLKEGQFQLTLLLLQAQPLQFVGNRLHLRHK